MDPAKSPVPARLLRGFFRVDDPLLVSRYRAALETIGAPIPDLRAGRAFHVDAAGYSPELAADLGDPFYLGAGLLSAHAVIVAAEQLGAPLVHPSLGYAADAYRKVTRASTAEIAGVTLREALIGDVQHPSTHLAATEQLADLAGFEIRFRTPGGLLQGVRQLEAAKAEFLESPRRWLDDTFIDELVGLAREVRDLGRISLEFAASSHGLGPFFSPAFGGSYVLEERGASSRSATTYVLCAEPSPAADGAPERRSARGRRVVVRRLEAAAAGELLDRHGIAHVDSAALRRRPGVLDATQHWIAVRHLLESDPVSPLAGADPAEVLQRMRGETDPPPEYLELEEVGRRLRADRGRIDPAALSPLTRLRLLSPSSTRGPIRRFVRHLLAFVDESHLERAWRDAPDVFFARWPGLSEARRRHFAGWLASQPED